ncbi:MAG TPA: sn-glycerol-1-phosphate dehydrogenase, partial [Ktedonobacter sp.]|nr:sn-glycerol-1-phosphate dehydrogenase [Ktedonobacter sp.]
MDYKRIDAALSLANDTRFLRIGTGILNDVGNVFEQAFGQQPAVIVADDNTYAIAGKAVYERLHASGWQLEEPVVFPG